MKTLRSYLEGRWIEGEGTGSTLHDAATGAPCAVVSSEGLDRVAALDFARRVGGPALRAMSFLERGAMLRQLSEAIHGAREELIELAREGGATRSDAKFDIDGASGTLAYYARLGEKLGESTLLRDCEPEKLLRSARFVGQHVWVSRVGVAIHINAFNFPAWGMAEKAAVALLAGMPVLAKPGTSTAQVAVRTAELWVETGALPAGAFSLLAGSAGDLLDGVGPQDCIAFTGSSATGRRIRGHQRVIDHNARVNVEADSLNVSILGPAVEPGSDTFQMFVGQVVRDMAQKAGQKCTAVRRILVPEPLADAAIDALRERLDGVVVGDPGTRGVDVGPVASLAQQRDVQHGSGQLDEHCDKVWSAPAPSGDGYYVSPALYRSDRGLDTPFVHEHEVFGPVATVLTWAGDAAGAVQLAAAGGGGLVASVYSDDPSWAGEVITGLAPWHGRIHWGSRKVHDQSPGPGTVLPNLVHGGPGRAGGGEELGGRRGLEFYMQRTAIQADRGLLQRAL